MVYTAVCASAAQGAEDLLELTSPPSDPLSQDWVICPHPESARWVSQLIAERRGLRVQVEIFTPSRWVNELQAQVWPTSPHLPSINRMMWATLRAGGQLGAQLGPKHELSRLFGTRDQSSEGGRGARRRAGTLRGRRLASALRYARALRRMMINRPHWVQAWESLPEDEALALAVHPDEDVRSIWPILWRTVSEILGAIEHQGSPSDHPLSWSDWLETLCRKVGHPDGGLEARVRRIIFYGHHRYDAQTLALAKACAQRVEVAFITVDPLASGAIAQGRHWPISETDECPALLRAHGAGFTAYQTLSRREDRSDEAPRDILQSLGPPLPFPVTPPPVQRRCVLTQRQRSGASLLSLLQRDLSLGLEPPPAPAQVDVDGSSLVFHSSYSDQRQVEDLYQSLMASFRRDRTLHPRDILVLCPDIERFAPLIQAVFNGGDEELDQGHHREGDKRPRRLGSEIHRPHGQSPYAQVLLSLLELSSSRCYRADVFELLKSPLVSARFHFTLSELLKVEQWVRASGVRWGVDAAHRVSCGLNDEAAHSWEFGLDRLLVGTLVGRSDLRALEALYGGISPLIIEGDENRELLSRFCEFFEMFKSARTALNHAHTPSSWCQILIDQLRLFTAAEGPEQRALRHDVEADLRRALRGSYAPTQQRVTPKAIRGLIDSGIGRQPTIIGGGHDHVRFIPLDQAFGSPARVICILNLSEGRFPKRSYPDPIDPLKEASLPIDLDPAHEQQANLISAILSAEDQLHIFYTGRRSSGERRPPCLLICALQEEIRGRYQLDQEVGDELIEALTITHPLHSFSPKNFKGDFDGKPTEETLSHDPLWLQGAQAWREAMQNPSMPRPFVGRPLEIASRGERRPRIQTLSALLKNPSEFFLQRGVGLRLLKDEEKNRERELLELDTLQNWSLRDRALSLMLSMEDSLEGEGEQGLSNSDWIDQLRAHVRAEGILPIGQLGEVSFEQMIEEVKSIYERFTQVRQGATRDPIGMTLQLPSGRPLRIDGEMRFGDRLIFMSPSRHRERVEGDRNMTRGERLLEPWLYHVALSASGAPFEGTSVIAPDGHFEQFPPLSQPQATTLLESWVDLIEEGGLNPLRFDPSLSWRWANQRAIGDEQSALEALQSASMKWRNRDNDYVKQAFGGEELWARPLTSFERASLEVSSPPQVSTERDAQQDRDHAELIEESPPAQVGLHPDFERCARLIFEPLAVHLGTEEGS